jgi:hypothetical protein
MVVERVVGDKMTPLLHSRLSLSFPTPFVGTCTEAETGGCFNIDYPKAIFSRLF